MRESDERYFDRIEARLDEAVDVARTAKQRGDDPSNDVEIPVAKDMADRVENLLGIDGVAARVRELDGELSREEAALELVTDFVEGSVGDFASRAGKVEGAVRTAIALLTEGVVAAPIEGIDRVEILTNDDGTEFVNVYYAGPIRSAGGTAQALSVLVADYARSLLGIDEYVVRSEEVERYAEEVALYDKETGLQYSPPDAETRFIARHMPIMLDGEPTGDEEVSGFRDIDRVDTNNPRGGMCLVLAEGIAQKAPKIQRYTRELKEVSWPWLQDLIDGTIADEETADEETADDGEVSPDPVGDAGAPSPGPPRVEPSKKYLRDLIAGRPVFGHPSEPGCFRLRYGRARNHGFATAGVHPATMHLVDDFLATGTQIKTERPGKAAGVVPVDSIEGPTVKLANGDVRRIDDPVEAVEVRNGVDEILDLGEYLVNYGEFVENNHALAPASYVVEWWTQDLEAAGVDVQALRDSPRVDLTDPTAAEALEWATEHDAPLHPKYTYLWHDLNVETFASLADAVATGGRYAEADGSAVAQPPASGADHTLVLPHDPVTCDALETLLVEHRQGEETITVPDAIPLVRTLGLTPDLQRSWTLEGLPADACEYDDGDNAIRAVNHVAPFRVREQAPTRVGARMGRPEKSEKRELSPAVHTLFPIGEAGGSQRDVGAAAGQRDVTGSPGEVEVEVGRRVCVDCGAYTYRSTCHDCGGLTDPHHECPDCGTVLDPDESGRAECPRCETAGRTTEVRTIDLRTELQDALDAVGQRRGAFDVLKGVKGLTSTHKVPEPLEKGVLRAVNGVSAFKDGTVRYDMTDLPVTAVRAQELDVTAETLRELGYTEDIDGEPLRHDDQLVELKVQDVVLSDGAADHMLDTAAFVDDLLERYYGLDTFYDVDDRSDLVGELVFGMAPHTSAAVIGRVIGFTSAAVGYAHPYFHAAKRRNCFHPATKVWYREEGGDWRHGPVERLVEDRLDDPDTDDVGTLVAELDGKVLVPSVTDDGREVVRPVTAVSKHAAPDRMLEVETRSGRRLRVTPDHRMLRWRDGVERIEASQLAVGDELPTRRQISVDGDIREYDLLAEFVVTDAVPTDELIIRGLGRERTRALLDDATPDEEYLQPVAEVLGVSDSTVHNWVSRDSIPVGQLLRLFDLDDLLDQIPGDVRLSVRRDTVVVDRHLTIDESFGSLLGYYAAEGFTRHEEGSYYQTTICIPEEAPRADVTETFERALGVEAYGENERKLTVSSRLVAALFADVLDAGWSARAKRIPDAVMGAPDSVLRSFLAAYFSGDGSVSSDRLDVRAHTVSDELKEDLLAALKRFGVVSKTYRETWTPESGAVAEYHDGDPPTYESWVLKVTSENAVRFAEDIGFDLDRKSETLHAVVDSETVPTQRIFGDGGDVLLDEVVRVDREESDAESTYCLTVEDTHALVANDLLVGQCDGDEDCVMLLMDGLLNFSKQYLPDRRGGRMDAPLVMSSRIDPSEIDDEAHNVDVVDRYSRKFYEATRKLANPHDVDVRLAEASLGTAEQYGGFRHTHDTSNIALGPALSAYKTLGSMDEKMDGQLELARKLRGVDETDVAERIIEYHFLPDLIGNLRAFSRQETRCLDCGEKYRRMPLTADCRVCGGDVNLTVHEGSVRKYMETATRVAEEFGCRGYTKQRLEVLDRSLESIFEDDTNKQSGIADFM